MIVANMKFSELLAYLAVALREDIRDLFEMHRAVREGRGMRGYRRPVRLERERVPQALSRQTRPRRRHGGGCFRARFLSDRLSHRRPTPGSGGEGGRIDVRQISPEGRR